jgi:hypothetical protein
MHIIEIIPILQTGEFAPHAFVCSELLHVPLEEGFRNDADVDHMQFLLEAGKFDISLLLRHRFKPTEEPRLPSNIS